MLRQARLGDRVIVRSSTVEESVIGDDSDVGPYAHLRGGSEIGPRVHIGNYAELKNARLAPGVKVGHFSYVGDAAVGEDTNIGAGAITANFDGAAKYAESLKLGGIRRWRVPTRKELEGIFPATEKPFTNTKYNENACCAGPGEYNSYWTSELDPRLDDYAWIYQWYAKGGANNGFASRNFVYVRCVHNPLPPSGPPRGRNGLTLPPPGGVGGVGRGRSLPRSARSRPPPRTGS